jgi:molecular chaperone GrpE
MMGESIEQTGLDEGMPADGDPTEETRDGSDVGEGATGAARELEDQAADEKETATSPKVVDKRRFARLLGFGFNSSGQGGESDVETPRERLPAYVEELKERAERVQAEARAETDAARARLERHYEGRLASARADVVATILPVFDNLERALGVAGAEESPLYEGLVATRDQFLKKLVELGVEVVPAAGEVFDPQLHEAVDSVEVEDAELDGRIVEVLQKGFQFGDRLVRPAIVRVGRAARGEAGN